MSTSGKFKPFLICQENVVIEHCLPKRMVQTVSFIYKKKRQGKVYLLFLSYLSM